MQLKRHATTRATAKIRREKTMARSAIGGMAPLVEAALGSGSNKNGGGRGRHSTTAFTEGDPSHKALVGAEIPARQYKHSRNEDDGVDSLCLKCRTVIACTDNEWSLLDCERGHVCNK